MNQLIITNTTITYNHQVIKTSNISSIDLKETIVNNKTWLIVIGAMSGFSAVLQCLRSIEHNFISGLFGAMISGSISFACFWYNTKQKKDKHNYLLLIYTNAGKQDLFSHKEYNFINGIRLKIQEALDSSSPSFNVTYDIDNSKTIINNPTGNITISYINQYSGLSEEDKNFLKSHFEPALQKIQQEVIKSSNEELKRNFELIKQELKSTKPRKTILETAWSVFSNLGTFAEFASTMDKAFNLF